MSRWVRSMGLGSWGVPDQAPREPLPIHPSAMTIAAARLWMNAPDGVVRMRPEVEKPYEAIKVEVGNSARMDGVLVLALHGGGAAVSRVDTRAEDHGPYDVCGEHDDCDVDQLGNHFDLDGP